MYPESKVKKNFAIACRGKKLRSSYGILRISRLASFNYRYFSSVLEVVQIEPNLA